MGKVATREAYGSALAQYGADERVIVLDADLSSPPRPIRLRKYILKDISIWVLQKQI